MRLVGLAALVASLASSLAPSTAIAQDATQTCLDASDAGQKLRSAHHLLEARANFVVCSAASCPRVVNEYCGRWLTEVEALIPTLVFSVRDDLGRDIDGLHVMLDGKPWLDSRAGVAVPVDPGPHTLRFEGAGRSVEHRIVVREGEKGRSVAIAWPSTSAPRAPAPAMTEPSRLGWLPWTLGGLGLASLGSFTYFGLTGNADLENLHDTCGRTVSCRQEDVDASRNKLIVADVSLVTGLLLLGGSALLFYQQAQSAPAIESRAR